MTRFSVLFYAFFTIITACSDYEDLVKTHIETKINKTADPCTDFYAHVCPTDLPYNQTVADRLRQLYQQEAAKFHTKHDEFLGHLRAYTLSFQKIVDDLLGVCDIPGDHKSQAIGFVNRTTGIEFSESLPCEFISYTFGMKASGKNPKMLFGEPLEMYFYGPRELEFSKSELGQRLSRNVENFFETFQGEVQKKFLETPWLINKNATEIYLEFLKSNFSLFQKTEKIIREWDMIFETLKNYSTNCKPNNTIPSFVCAMEELNKLIKEEARPSMEFYMFGQGLDALNLDDQILINRANQFLTLTNNKARMLGGFGFIVAHEIMHTFYSSENNDNILKKYWTNSSQCVRKQYAATCREFGQEQCFFSGTMMTNEEDGSDLAAIRVIYSDFEKNYLHNEKSDIAGVTPQQMFFYSLASLWCTDSQYSLGTLGSHSDPYIRVNALLAQMDEFKESFQCAEDSRMVRSKVEHCEIFGSDAPQTRKSSHNALLTDST
ncbi:unnamed protein product [Caenorhabditis auriculariae]|uniref:Peptidase M13 C-terminal domain-containing protein n=1 Tax=Caenorhabditis auriculariae TaxID=2777116 RepID=A0A8S1GR80_9PELO|nr:unnamed protein product [Caenorhabditis auriculariae]